MLGSSTTNTVSINVGVSEARVWRTNEKIVRNRSSHVVPSLSFFCPRSRPTPFTLSFAGRGYAQKEKDRAETRLVAYTSANVCPPSYLSGKRCIVGDNFSKPAMRNILLMPLMRSDLVPDILLSDRRDFHNQ